jgi:restriction system protein
MVLHWSWLLIIAPVLVLPLILRSAWFKGKLGEFKVNVGVMLLLDRKIYRLVKNVTLPIDGGTTQIDHLLVSPYGIFVIETKSMKGWIFDQPNQAQWMQVIYRFKQRFQKPLRQNFMHVKAVRDLFGLEADQLYNVVVFVGNCRFKNPMPAEVMGGVFDLARFIRKKRVPLFTENEVRRFIENIRNKRLDSGFRTERIHVQNVKRRISENACPRCGGVMVERLNGHSGESFLGCRRFPVCRGVRPLM